MVKFPSESILAGVPGEPTPVSMVVRVAVVLPS